MRERRRSCNIFFFSPFFCFDLSLVNSSFSPCLSLSEHPWALLRHTFSNPLDFLYISDQLGNIVMFLSRVIFSRLPAHVYRLGNGGRLYLVSCTTKNSPPEGLPMESIRKK